MEKKTIYYSHEGVTFKGQIVYDAAHLEKRPAVLVAHAWKGQDDFARTKAEELAKLGYIGFAIDLYGNGKEVHTPDEAAHLMQPLFQDRALLQARLNSALHVLQAYPLVDRARIGGIGFCFGGLAIIELLRSGAPIKGVASFHAVLGSKGATTVPIAKDIEGSLLILHGYDDPLVSQEDIIATQKEFNEAGVDWQMHTYGHTSHAFTVPGSNDPTLGLKYNALTAARSWEEMRRFFSELFSRACP